MVICYHSTVTQHEYMLCVQPTVKSTNSDDLLNFSVMTITHPNAQSQSCEVLPWINWFPREGMCCLYVTIHDTTWK